MNSAKADNLAKPVTFQTRIDLLQLQKEADDLARTAQTIPSDIHNVRRGILPKDVIQKLKPIQKRSSICARRSRDSRRALSTREPPHR